MNTHKHLFCTVCKLCKIVGPSPTTPGYYDLPEQLNITDFFVGGFILRHFLIFFFFKYDKGSQLWDDVSRKPLN